MFRMIREICHRNSYCVNSYLTLQLREFLMCRKASHTSKRYMNEESDKTNKKNLKHAVPVEISDVLMTYFKFNKNFQLTLNNLPKNLIKLRRKNPEALYVIDPDVASTIADHVRRNIKRDSFIMELNPGFGLLSKELCSAGIDRIRLFESLKYFSRHLNELNSACSNKLELKFKDLFSLFKISYQDRLDGGSRVDELLDGVPKREWTDDPALTIIGVLPTMLFINALIYSLILQHGIMLYGRPELYLVVNETFYINLTCQGAYSYNHYRTTAVLFQLFFTLELLEKLPRKAFLPWEGRKSRSKISNDIMYLVKIEARRDLFEKILPVEQLQLFWYFVKHHMTSRKNRVIPCLEQWIPGCGPRLLIKGMDLYTEFGELTPQEILELFYDFSNWPEYVECPFIPSMDTALLKLDHSDRDSDTVKQKDRNTSSSSDSGSEENLEHDGDVDAEDKHSVVH